MGFNSMILVFIVVVGLCPYWAAAVTYNVVNLGAKGDGKTDSTKAFLHAWTAACASASPATIYVPPGRYFLRNAVFSGCKNHAITFRIDATLVAPADYRVIGNAGNWLAFEDVTGVSILGGILDGQGTGLWACKNSGKSCPSGATTLGFTNSNNILISGLTSLNSQKFHIVINGCQNVKLQGVRVSASGDSPNTDGIHVQLSSGVTILDTKIKTGDDCVSIGPGASNLWIENVACGPGHGISVGSLGKELKEAGVQNVTVKTVTFTGSQNGVRIKSWARASSGFARVSFSNTSSWSMSKTPFSLTNITAPTTRTVSGVKVSDVTYQDIHGTSATEVAVKFDCSSKYPCSGINLKDVKLTYKNKAAEASCANADGKASGFIEPESCL
ncbi:hypothetical protein AAG906_031883 [Vitis piasezkii]